MVCISASWLNSSLLRFKEERRQNNHRKLCFMVPFIFLSNFPSHIISISHFKHFSLSFLYWIWHFHSSSFAYWMWYVECSENNYFYMAIYYMMYNNTFQSHISQCLSKAFILFQVNITCALQSLFQCSNMLMAMSFLLSTWWITPQKYTEEKRLFILWNPNKSSRKACRVRLIGSLLKAKWAKVK